MPPKDSREALEQAEDDLNRLERGIRELKIAYDRFFAGALKREPLSLKFELNKIIKRYHETPLKAYGHRFRFNSLVARFNVLNEILTKGVRKMEGGDQRHNANADDVDLGLVSKCRVSDPREQSDALRSIHKEFVQHRIRNGVNNAKVPFERFVKGIEAQAAKLKATKGCDDVEVRLVVKDNKVQLTARAGASGPGERSESTAPVGAAASSSREPVK